MIKTQIKNEKLFILYPKNCLRFFSYCFLFFFRGQVYGPITFGSGSLPTDWTNDSSWTFSTSNASSGYTTPSASGSGNATIINGASNTQYLTSANIDFSSFKSGILKFGVVKSSTSFTKDLVVSVDINNAGTYTAFASTVSNTTISTNWSLITLNLGTVIDSKSQVKIRFNTIGSASGTPNIRIDDVTLYGTAGNSSYASVTAGLGTEPATLSSLINTQASSSLNFDFLVTDDANTTNGNDSLPTLISQIVIAQGAGNDIAEGCERKFKELFVDRRQRIY